MQAYLSGVIKARKLNKTIKQLTNIEKCVNVGSSNSTHFVIGLIKIVVVVLVLLLIISFVRSVLLHYLNFFKYVFTEKCDSALGMKNKAIPDESITSSSNLDSNHEAKHGRGRFERENKEAWCSAEEDAEPYIQIKFVEEKAITAVKTQGSSTDLIYSRKYKVMYLDGGAWTPYKEVHCFHFVFQIHFKGRGLRRISRWVTDLRWLKPTHLVRKITVRDCHSEDKISDDEALEGNIYSN